MQNWKTISKVQVGSQKGDSFNERILYGIESQNLRSRLLM